MTDRDAEVREWLAYRGLPGTATLKELIEHEREITRHGAAAALAREDRAHTVTIGDRDRAEEWANNMAGAIAEMTGVAIGEHSNANDPWENALNAVIGHRCEMAGGRLSAEVGSRCCEHCGAMGHSRTCPAVREAS